MALTKQELKEVFKIVNSIKNSGMNPWGNIKRGKDMKITKPRRAIYNKEDADPQAVKEKFKKKS
jgi:hypothetical protein